MAVDWPPAWAARLAATAPSLAAPTAGPATAFAAARKCRGVARGCRCIRRVRRVLLGCVGRGRHRMVRRRDGIFCGVLHELGRALRGRTATGRRFHRPLGHLVHRQVVHVHGRRLAPGLGREAGGHRPIARRAHCRARDRLRRGRGGAARKCRGVARGCRCIAGRLDPKAHHLDLNLRCAWREQQYQLQQWWQQQQCQQQQQQEQQQ